MDPWDNLTPKLDPLHQPPQSAVPHSTNPPAQDSGEVGFVLYDPDHAKYLLQLKAAKMKLPWPMIQGAVHQIVDDLYAEGVIFAKAIGANQQIVQQELVAHKAKLQIPVRLRSLPGGVKTERA